MASRAERRKKGEEEEEEEEKEEEEGHVELGHGVVSVRIY